MFHMLDEPARLSDHYQKIFLSGIKNAARGRQVWQPCREQNSEVGAQKAILLIIHLCLIPENSSLCGTQVFILWQVLCHISCEGQRTPVGYKTHLRAHNDERKTEFIENYPFLLNPAQHKWGGTNSPLEYNLLGRILFAENQGTVELI
jgi:hypothetical protein